MHVVALPLVSTVAALPLLLSAVALPPGPAFAVDTSDANQQTISDCSTIRVPGSYLLDRDLSVESGACFVVLAPEVVLDMGGHTITGSFNGTGIHVMRAAARTQVMHGTVTSFAVGIESDADSVTLSYLQTTKNVGAGIEVLGGSEDIVSRSTISGNHLTGLAVQDARAVQLLGNVVTDNGTYGVALQGTSYATVEDAAIIGNGASGIELGCLTPPSDAAQLCPASTGNRMMRNFITDNGGAGIAIERGSSGNTLNGNTALRNARFDLVDANMVCGINMWQNNQFLTRNNLCLS